MDAACESAGHSVVSDFVAPWTEKPARLLCSCNSPGKNTRMSNHPLLQGIFLNQGPNPGLLHCRWILYHLNHQGSPDAARKPRKAVDEACTVLLLLLFELSVHHCLQGTLSLDCCAAKLDSLPTLLTRLGPYFAFSLPDLDLAHDWA